MDLFVRILVVTAKNSFSFLTDEKKKKSNIGLYHERYFKETELSSHAEEKILKEMNALQMKVNRREKRLKLLQSKLNSLDKWLHAFSKSSPTQFVRKN